MYEREFLISFKMDPVCQAKPDSSQLITLDLLFDNSRVVPMSSYMGGGGGGFGRNDRKVSCTIV